MKIELRNVWMAVESGGNFVSGIFASLVGPRVRGE
jgi:hypothetical protein